MPKRPPTGSTARPMSKSGRQGTALQRPPTGSRLGTARPGTKAGVAPGTGALASQVQVTDRPMTQQGVSGVKTGSMGPQRQVQDATYYLALLRAKTSELRTEITKLGNESGALNAENATYLTFERRAETLASQLKERQGELADYNLLIDKLNTNTDLDEVSADHADLEAQNNKDSKTVEILFGERRDKEKFAAQLEQEIQQQRTATNALLQELDYETQAKYMGMKENNFELQQAAERLQSELDNLTVKESSFQAELESNSLKQRAVEINQRISELTEKRNTLKADIASESQLSPEEEKEKHLRQVKEDNQEIAGFESRIKELKSKIENCQEEVARCEDSLLDQDSDQAKKYKELKKREEQIEEYLAKHDALLSEEKEKKGVYEGNIVKLLEAVSTGLSRAKLLPSQHDFKALKDDLEFKSTEAERATETLEALQGDRNKLQHDFEQLEALETKIRTEMIQLQEKIGIMTEELTVFSDIAGLRREMEEKKESLAEEKEQLLSCQETSKINLDTLNKEFVELKKSLEENETSAQLTNLERKWQHIEQNNNFMKEFIANKSQESDYIPIRKAVCEQVLGINTMLQQQLNIAATN